MAKQQLGNIGATTTAAKSSTTASHRPSRDSKERTGECLDDIEDSKKWRLIQESGLLEKIHIPTDKHIHTTSNASESNQDESILGVRRDYISEGVLFSIPTTCLFIIIDILVHRQAGDDYSTQLIVQKILKIFPGKK
ncbi:hypothetical protein BGZ54_001771 [Gamsiella multidivaricata]|nr:hypothetical protein BGZ54_001771 [Gamsiella multidivaricata]